MDMLRYIAQVTIPSTDQHGNRVIPLIPLTQTQLKQLLSNVFIVVGALAVLFIIVGAARYITSNGEQAKISQAKNTIIYAVIGLIISLSAFTIVQFAIGAVN